MKLLNRLSKLSNSDLGSKIGVSILMGCDVLSVLFGGMVFYHVISEFISIPLFLLFVLGIVFTMFINLRSYS